MHHQDTVVETYLAGTELSLAEARPRGDKVATLALLHQCGADGVEITIAPRPEMQVVQALLGLDMGPFSRLQGNGMRRETGYLLPLGIEHLGSEGEGTSTHVVVLDLRLDMHNCPSAHNVIVGCVDIGTRCS